MTNNKIKTLDAVQSLVTTAIKWTNREFPDPRAGVEEQTLREILNDLTKVNTALENLILYQKGLVDTKPVIVTMVDGKKELIDFYGC